VLLALGPAPAGSPGRNLAFGQDLDSGGEIGQAGPMPGRFPVGMTVPTHRILV